MTRTSNNEQTDTPTFLLSLSRRSNWLYSFMTGDEKKALYEENVSGWMETSVRQMSRMESSLLVFEKGCVIWAVVTKHDHHFYLLQQLDRIQQNLSETRPVHD